MSISDKSKRCIEVGGKTYYWYIKNDDWESAVYQEYETPVSLVIVSEDKSFYKTVPVSPKRNLEALPYPFDIPDEITPSFVRTVIEWSISQSEQDENKEEGEHWKCLFYDETKSLRANYTKIIEEDDRLSCLIYCGEITAEVSFFGHTPLWLSSDELLRMRSWAPILSEYGKYYFHGRLIFRIESSGLLRWAEKESEGFYNGRLSHYRIVTANDVIDVLSSCPPEFHVINNADQLKEYEK